MKSWEGQDRFRKFSHGGGGGGGVVICNKLRYAVERSHQRLLNPFLGVSPRCEGRLEFQTLPVGSLPRLNITNDIPARTPADCAKKCFETVSTSRDYQPL